MIFSEKNPKSSASHQHIPVINDRNFRVLIEKSSDIIALINAKGKVLYVSSSIFKLYGYKPKYFIGKSGFKFIHPSDAPKVLKTLTDLVSNPKRIVSTEFRIQHKDGHWIWLECIATNLLHDPNIKGIIINFHDISERKELEERKDEFIYMASHELKTPITSLQGFAYLLKKRMVNKDEKAQYYADKILELSNNQLRLINDLLDISRIKTGKIVLRKKEFQIETLVEEVCEDMKRTAKNRQIIIKNTCKATIFADRERIGQVLINILSNALKYSPQDLPVEVSTKYEEGRCSILVKDYGKGMPKEEIRNIFKRFYRIKSNAMQTASGLGLGLYICASIVKLHKGEISVKSKKNKGSEFTVILPDKHSSLH